MGENFVAERINPVKKANFLSLCTFGYTLDLFRTGYRRDIEQDDLYGLTKSCKSVNCGAKSETEWIRSNKSFLKFFLKRYGCKYLFFLVMIMIWTELQSVLQPYASSRLISHFGRNQTDISRSEAMTCGAIVIFLNYLRYFFWKNLHVYEIIVAINMFTTIKCLLYRKALKMSRNSLTETNVGNIVTIITKDIYCIEYNPWVYVDMTVLVVQTATGLYLLWMKIGNAAYLGIGLLMIALPLQAYLSWLLMRMRLTVAKKSDERNQIIQEVLSALKVVKMYVWENFFIKKIDKIRQKEVARLIHVFFIKFIVVGIGMLSSKLNFLALIVFYVYLGNTPDTETLFYILTIYQQISTSLSVNIPTNLSIAAQIHASIHRINTVLQAKEDYKDEKFPLQNESCTEPFIYLKNVTVKINEETVLRNICMDLKKPSLIVITGPVGSGKSSLLKLLLKDYFPSQGEACIRGRISYASQEPWLFPSSIRQNILFGQTFYSERYKVTIRSCALDYDLSQLKYGDETLVADRGQNLSKGQQARINLARAIYRESDIYLLDDSLTSLNENIQDFIFNESILKMLKQKIVIIVSQNKKHIQRADQIILMEKGQIVSKINQNIEQKVIELKNYNIANKKETIKVEPPSLPICQNGTSNIVEENNRKVYEENKKQGKVDLDVYRKYFQFGGGFIFFTIIMCLYTLAQYFDSYSDKLLTSWIDLQHDTLVLSANGSEFNETYKKIIQEKEYTFNMYIITTLFQAGFSLLKFYIFLVFCRKASLNIHKTMLENIIKAFISFFDRNYVGNILNRFSFDVNNIDEYLPFLFPQLAGLIFGCTGSFVLICTVSGMLILPLAIIVLLLIIMRTLTIPSMRSLKRLEAITRSPLIGHINATMEGLTTIRAFQAEELFIREFDKHQDNYNCAVFTSQLIGTAFDFFMSMVTCFATVIVIARFLFFEHDMSVGDIGLAIGQVGLITELAQSLVKYWADLESNMTSVERALEYTSLDREEDGGKDDVKWDSTRDIFFNNVSLSYCSTGELVLKNVTFSVEEGQKIGIVGRTGAGKSSIIAVIYRLYDFGGLVEIGHVDIRKISLSYLRKNIAIIPQDPILFTGTIRDNIDPYREYTEDQIWAAVTKVKLKSCITNLDATVIQNGVGFSVGQKQLICLARAALRHNDIVILDEATANMDVQTEMLLYNVIEEVFSECTILIIAHRLEYIKKCDKVMVIESGHLVEYCPPDLLFRDGGSLFQSMYIDDENQKTCNE